MAHQVKCSNAGVPFNPPSKENTCAIVVTYDPNISLLDVIKTIASQMDRVVIVDNTPGNEAMGLLQRLAESSACELVINGDNLGVATALNQGVERALLLGYRWVAMFDQDSVPVPSFLESLKRIYTSFPERHRVGIIGANYIHASNGLPAQKCMAKQGSDFVEVTSVITSGSLLNLAAFLDVGRFRDDFFIDQVDEEYCLRLRSHGWKVLMSCQPLLICTIGNPSLHRLLWKRVYCSNHPPIRRYYITRNRVVLWRKYFLREPKWAIQSIKSSLIELMLILFCEDCKLAKLRKIMLGALHGIIGRMGRLNVPDGL